MREYETVFILRPTVEDARVEEEIEGIQQVIRASGGEVLGVDRWGRRRLAYEIQRSTEGIYTLVRFRAKAGVIQDLERRYRLREDVLRHLTVLSQGAPPEAAIRREGEAATSEPAAAAVPETTMDPGQSPTEEIQAGPEANSQLP